MIPQYQGLFKTRGGNLVPNNTICGWEILVGFKDGSSNLIKLENLNQSNPVELAKYAVTNGLTEELKLKWCVKDVLKKRYCIVTKLNSKYWWTSHKFDKNQECTGRI